MKKNLFLTFCFSFIPGAGQMYQDYMKRGVSICILFVTCISIALMTSLPIFVMPALIVYAYSFFDTYNIRNKIGTENSMKDEYIFASDGFKSLGINFNKKNNFIAVIFILIGIYVLLNNVLLSIASRYELEFMRTIIRIILNYLPSIIIAGASIGFGIKFIGKGKGDK